MNKTDKPWPWPFRSCASWPTGTFPSQNELTRDYHHSREQAEGVCSLLHAKGAGGDGKVFPLRTWVEQEEAAPVTETEHTPGPWTVMEGKTLLHIETANMGDGSPCGMPVCSVPKNRRRDAELIAAAPETARQRDDLAKYRDFWRDKFQGLADAEIEAVTQRDELLSCLELAVRGFNTPEDRERYNAAIVAAGGRPCK